MRMAIRVWAGTCLWAWMATVGIMLLFLPFLSALKAFIDEVFSFRSSWRQEMEDAETDRSLRVQRLFVKHNVQVKRPGPSLVRVK